MKIKKFTKIKARTFKDFTWPQDLPEFSDYNLIYGWNASGKTTLADILRMVEKQQFIDQKGIYEFSITAEGNTTITNNNIEAATSSPTIRVFNHTFIEENVFTQNGALPIFFIGEENIEKQKDLERQKEALKNLRDIENEKKKKKDRKIKDLDTFLQAKASEVRGWLSITNPQLYNKEHFKSNCVNLVSEDNEQQHLKNAEQLGALKKTISSTVLDKISPISANLPNIGLLCNEVKVLLEKTVISRTIEALAQNQQISNWVKDGLKIHTDHKSENCEFCLQKLPAARIKELEEHFNDQFKALEIELNAKINVISQKISDLDNIQAPDSAKLYPALVPNYQDTVKKFNEQKLSYIEFLNALKMALENKKSNPFRKVQFDTIVPAWEASQLDTINSIISKHNKCTENFNQTINDAKEAIKQSIAAESLHKYQELHSALKNIEEEYSTLFQSIIIAEQKINSLEQEIMSHKKPAEDINNDLQDYLGHDELRFVTDDQIPGYIIMRGDERAHALSEGEKSSIALLYFLKSLEDSDFKLNESIVVIDDPVSSLDDLSLFYAFSYIKNRTKEAIQVIILTHNFSLFRQVRDWFNYERKPRKNKDKSCFFQVVCTIGNGKRISRIEKMDHLLIDYESEYHYLFSLIYRKANSTGGESLDQHYNMPNIARRFLEAFLAFRFPSTSGNLYKSLEKSGYNPSKKQGIARFLHTYSHKSQVGTPEHDSTILSQTPQILSDILGLTKFEDEKHYNEMIELVEGVPDTDN